MSAPLTPTLRARILSTYRCADLPVHTKPLIDLSANAEWHSAAPCIIRCAECGRALNDAQVLSEVEVPAPPYAESRSKAKRGDITETWFRCPCGHEQLSRNRVESREWWAGLSRWRIDN